MPTGCLECVAPLVVASEAKEELSQLEPHSRRSFHLLGALDSELLQGVLVGRDGLIVCERKRGVVPREL